MDMFVYVINKFALASTQISSAKAILPKSRLIASLKQAASHHEQANSRGSERLASRHGNQVGEICPSSRTLGANQCDKHLLAE
jgi:hypothetical protein